jgi:pimeloyl-ACP methyl ester carboxylesterase
MQRVEWNGLQIAYERAGEGPPLVLLHGAISDHREWRTQLAELSDEFDVIAWDAPGNGKSSDPDPPFDTGDWADALAGLLEALDVGPAHVGGLSWGGTLALELYGRHAGHVASLILVDTYAGWKGSLPADKCAARVEACLREAEMDPAEVAPRWLPGLLTEDTPREVADELVAIMSEAHPAGFRLMAISMGATDQRDLLPTIDVPALLVWGEADVRSPLSVAEAMHAAIPGAQLVVIPRAGHMSNMEQPARFNAEVREFIHNIDT